MGAVPVSDPAPLTDTRPAEAHRSAAAVGWLLELTRILIMARNANALDDEVLYRAALVELARSAAAAIKSHDRACDHA